MASTEQIRKNSNPIAMLLLHHITNIYHCIGLDGEQSKFNANFACRATFIGNAVSGNSVHLRGK